MTTQYPPVHTDFLHYQPRMVKIFILANFQKNTTLTAAAANPTPSCLTQRGQPQRPFNRKRTVNHALPLSA